MRSEGPDVESLSLALSLGRGAISALAALAALLPLFILASAAPISHADPAILATFHLRTDFWLRAGLTFVYFPSIIALHYAVQPAAARPRAIFLCGLVLFIAGNVIDLPFRATQFFTVGGTWGAEWLAAHDLQARAAAAARIDAFAQIAPAISFSFTLLFAIGRLLMGSALWAAGKGPVRIAAAGLLVTGLWNLAAVAKDIPGLSFLGTLGTVYVWVWLAGILAFGLGAHLATRR